MVHLMIGVFSPFSALHKKLCAQYRKPPAKDKGKRPKYSAYKPTKQIKISNFAHASL